MEIGMNKNHRDVNEIITSLFENISPEKMKSVMNVLNGWKSTVGSIKSTSNKNLGEYLVAHTKVIDLKNGILLVETDHPGYIQILQMYKSYILRGLKQKYPELEINCLSFRLKGTDVKLHDVEKNTESQKIEKKQRENVNIEIKKDLPDELKDIFSKLKEEIENKDIDQN